MKWQLVVNRGQRKGLVIPLARLPFSIGRGEECRLRPVAPDVSRHHCDLVTHGGRLVVVDCQTTNGTFVNGQRIEVEQELRPGDHLQIGSLEFLIDLVEAALPSARRPLDEDAIGEMLLAMDEEENALG
jgi:pSer/pThr/pTyr-binding forkhead associated (FHA) protein